MFLLGVIFFDWRRERRQSAGGGDVESPEAAFGVADVDLVDKPRVGGPTAVGSEWSAFFKWVFPVSSPMS